MSKIEIPQWLEVAGKYKNNEELSPLESFVYQYEPAGRYDKHFRRNLEKMLKYVVDKREKKILNWLRNDLASRGIMSPRSDLDKGWNEFNRETIRVIDQYLKGKGLFQEMEKN